MNGSLTYDKVAYESKHGWSGLMYIHAWPTGAQQLIFSSHRKAAKFADTMGLELLGVPEDAEDVVA